MKVQEAVDAIITSIDTETQALDSVDYREVLNEVLSEIKERIQGLDDDESNKV